MYNPYYRNGERMGNSPQGQPRQIRQNSPQNQSQGQNFAPQKPYPPTPPPQGELGAKKTEQPSQKSEKDKNCLPEITPAKGQMTQSSGYPVINDQNTLTIGTGGQALLEDIQLLDKMAHFDRERIPERVVHAKGAGAFGVFRTTGSMAEYTTADFLREQGRETPVLVRFSTVIGGRGSPDSVRDPRGFATKFYTEQGVCDIVGNSLPVFFIRDAIKFPDVIHSLKPAPDSNLRNPERFWDFCSLTPEATHMITWLYSDRGTIRDYRRMEGFGVNTYVWVNKNSVRHFVKYHWKTLQGIETIDRFEAESLQGSDPDIAGRRLFEAIEKKDFPSFELMVQLMTEERAKTLTFDPLDDTKTWPEAEFPLKSVGVMTLNRNPQSFFAQIEQAAFCPGNLVPGIELSADKMLQGRSFSYLDTQRYRLGANFMQLPVNRSRSPVVNNQRDGAMAFSFNPAPINYSPNSLGGNQPKPAEIPQPKPLYAKGDLGRFQIAKTDDFTQAGERYRGLKDKERAHLCDNIAVELWKCKADIIERMLSYFEKADAEFAKTVRRDMEKHRSAAL
ncbi:MAG: catalase [Oscillospiraceae bacterium]